MSEEKITQSAEYTLRGVTEGVSRFARVKVEVRPCDGPIVSTSGNAARIGISDWVRGARAGAAWALSKSFRRWEATVIEIEGLKGQTSEGDTFIAATFATLAAMGEQATTSMLKDVHTHGDYLRSMARYEEAVKAEDAPEATEKALVAAREAKAGDVRVVPIITVGRIVHYMNLGDKDGEYPPETQAALVTGVNADSTPSLVVFSRTGFHNVQSVPYAETPSRGHWSWPPGG